MATSPFTPDPSNLDKAFQAPSAKEIEQSNENSKETQKAAQKARNKTQAVLDEIGIDFD